MGTVVYMDMQHKRTPVVPKCEIGMHMGQRYTLQFDPNAPPSQAWVWIVDYVRKFQFVGSAGSVEAAARAARKQIKELVNK